MPKVAKIPELFHGRQWQEKSLAALISALLGRDPLQSSFVG